MCGRIRQARSLNDYQETLRWSPFAALEVPEGIQQNVAPGTRPIALHRLGDGTDQATRLFWGYKPAEFSGGPASYCQLDPELEASQLWKPLLSRRIIVPVDGWYEWTGEDDDRQPWYISACDQGPIYLAGITAWEPGRDILAETGFAIITDNTAGGIVDPSDRRPVCLSQEEALAWLDYTLTPEEALEILSVPRPEGILHWWPVTKEMSSSKYQLPDCCSPIEFAPQQPKVPL